MLLPSWLAACGPIALGGSGCSVISEPSPLPPSLDEASGAAVGVADPGVVWSHGDGGRLLAALDRHGTLRAAFRLDRPVFDWEDMAAAPCVDGGGCLYLADVGDNYERRATIQVLRAREPALSDGSPTSAGRLPRLPTEAFPMRLPDGPRDIEALVVLPGERLLLVTKGRNHPVTVYRYPGRLRPDTVTLVEVQRLTDEPRFLPRQVTGASALGEVVAVRTYESLRFYRLRGDVLEESAGPVNLRLLGEAQGEGVALGPGGLVFLTSEAGPLGSTGSIAAMRCPLAP